MVFGFNNIEIQLVELWGYFSYNFDYTDLRIEMAKPQIIEFTGDVGRWQESSAPVLATGDRH